MHVTDDMVHRLDEALDACEFTTPYKDRQAILRRVLEFTVGDLPEPRIDVDALRESVLAYDFECDCPTVLGHKRGEVLVRGGCPVHSKVKRADEGGRRG